MALKPTSKGSLEKQLKREIGALLKAAAVARNQAVLDTLQLLAEPITEAGVVVGDVTGIGSPTWSGNYQINHRIAVNGQVEPPELDDMASPAYPLTVSPEEIVEREAPKLRKTKFIDQISIVNDDPKADILEDFGSPLVPEGGFYHRAYQFLDERLKSVLGQVVSYNPSVGDENW